MNYFLVEKAFAEDSCEKRYYSLREILKYGFSGESSEKNLDAINCFAKSLTMLLLDIAIGVAIIMILYSAFLYVTSYGNESQAETAKKTLIWSIVGLFVMFLARVLVSLIRNALA